MQERRESVLQRLFEEGKITSEERALLADRPRLQASTALAYAAGAALVVLGVGLVGAVLGVTASVPVRLAVVGGLAAALTGASWLLHRRRLLPAALALYLGALGVWGAVVQLSGGALWPNVPWAQVAEWWAFLLVAVAFWNGWRGPALTGAVIIAGYLAVITSARVLLGGSPAAGHLAVDCQVALAALLIGFGIWMSRRPSRTDHALWACLIGLVFFDVSLITTSWAGTVDGWWLVAAQALLVFAFWQVGRSALGGLAVLGGLAFLSRQISMQLLPQSPLAAISVAIVIAAATLVLGSAYLRNHPLPQPADRGSVWWEQEDL
ncbi:MAG: hypothetical protein ACYCO4_02395 [Sulfobacillus sp.]